MTVGESGKPFFGRQLIIAASRRMSDCREFDAKAHANDKASKQQNFEGETMTDREGHRFGGLSWRREGIDSDMRPPGKRGDNSVAGWAAANSSSSSSSSSSNGNEYNRRAPPAAHGSFASDTRGFDAFRTGGMQKIDHRSTLPHIPASQANAAAGATAAAAPATAPVNYHQQQRRGHTAAPVSRGSFAVLRQPAVHAAHAEGPVSPSSNRAATAAAPNRRGAEAQQSPRGFAAFRRGDSSSNSSSNSSSSSSSSNRAAHGNNWTSSAGSPEGAGESRAPAAAAAPTAAAAATTAEGVQLWRPRRVLTREEEVNRNVKSLLNKLTIEKFKVIAEKLAQTLEQSLQNPTEIRIQVDAIIDKAVTEPDWSEIYACVCLCLKAFLFVCALTVYVQLLQWRSVAAEGDPDTIRRTPFMLGLLTRIQEEFEAMPAALQHEVHGESEEMQQEATRIKRRVLGVVKLIGELFHRKLLGFKIVNDVVVELVMRSEEPDEYLVECFLQLISTVGFFIDQNPKMKVVLDSWFGRLKELQTKNYSKRLKCVIQDTFDMRRADWRKKIHRERAKALNELHDQLETEEVLGGAVHAAQYGNIVVVGERTNLNGEYLDYLKQQEEQYQERVAKRIAAAQAAAACKQEGA
ncbi:eukaryotic translation intiation factor, putative [Eimeria acervulina]|uniref:Eukaryotic translation intiation factor, putative n=1 Tax=Eimeria acervulina TaxID=5801 RepID=U6GI35_EIMAC|nr:eukaryotic translation intiation factor, putative [Eimeria acervulina]CDI79921.1 eukaryotic translation intiation factor, putative [Eimeria acervulina]